MENSIDLLLGIALLTTSIFLAVGLLSMRILIVDIAKAVVRIGFLCEILGVITSLVIICVVGLPRFMNLQKFSDDLLLKVTTLLRPTYVWIIIAVIMVVSVTLLIG
jgi:hypothetical protein